MNNPFVIIYMRDKFECIKLKFSGCMMISFSVIIYNPDCLSNNKFLFFDAYSCF